MNRTARQNKAMLMDRIARWEKKVLAADESQLQSMADSLAQQEKSVTDAPAEVAVGQNARANANWPMPARIEVASRLTKLASALLADDDDDADDKPFGDDDAMPADDEPVED